MRSRPGPRIAFLGLLALVSLGLALTSRVGWPWRYHLLPLPNDAIRDSMRDPWRMTPVWPSLLFLALGLAAAGSAVRAVRTPPGAPSAPFVLAGCFVALLFLASLNWLLAWNGV